ncbi:MAG: SMC-Scp complex subunit ScpB [Pseudomonadota bacterium]
MVPDSDLETAEASPARLVEALLFAAAEPVDEADLRDRLPADADLQAILADLVETYRNRGVVLTRVANGWAFRTAPDLAPHLRLERASPRKLSRVGLETMAIIAYHQPVTRAEIENIRGVATSKGTLDILMEAGWIRPGRRRQTPGRPLTWITTKGFLDHFGLASLDELPGIEELKATGFLDSRPAIATLPGGLMDGQDAADGEGAATDDDELPASDED